MGSLSDQSHRSNTSLTPSKELSLNDNRDHEEIENFNLRLNVMKKQKASMYIDESNFVRSKLNLRPIFKIQCGTDIRPDPPSSGNRNISALPPQFENDLIDSINQDGIMTIEKEVIITE